MGLFQPRFRLRSPLPTLQLKHALPAHQGLLIALTSTLLSGCTLIEDQFNLVPKPPSAEIERLAQVTTMTPLAQRLFYRQEPKIETRSSFLEQCQVPKDSIVLGCYLEERWGESSGEFLRDRIIDSRIVIQNITDPQFQGTMEVTAAHEMLHAAYAKLDEAEKALVLKHLEEALEKVKNKRLLKVLDSYKTQDFERYQTELYAHLGTELAVLDDPILEEHYKKYFSDRQTVISFAQQSVQVITDLDRKAEALNTEIEQLEAQLKADQQALEREEEKLMARSQNLQTQQTQLESLRASAEAALRDQSFRADQLINQFEREKRAFNNDVEDYNSQVKQQKERAENFNQTVRIYQAKIDSYNQVAQDSRQVLESLKGSTEPLASFDSP